MAADIDVRTIAVFASVSESSIQSLLSQPTAESISSFFQNLGPRAKHCDEVKAQKTKLEVELETVVRTNESKVKVLQNSRDKALADSSQLRQDLQASESKRVQAEADRERVQQSIESDASETTTLRAKIGSLENSHRDTLSLLESKSKEIDRLVRDLTDEHQKVVSLRKEVSTLDKEKQEAVSKSNTALFKQTSLEQELDLQKKNIDWYESERKIKNDEHQKFRREKNARLAELQQSLDQQIEQTDALRRSENLLRSQLEDSTRRNEELVLSKKKLLDEKNADAQHHLATVEGLRRLGELHETNHNTAKARVEELSLALDEAREEAAEEIGRIRAEVQEEHNDRQAAEQRIAELEAKLSEAEADALQPRQEPASPLNNTNGPVPSTPARPSTPVSFTPRSTHRFKNSMSTTQLYSEYTKIEKELDKERKANEQLQAHIESMVDDLEASGPQIEELRSDQARLQEEVLDMSRLADEAKEQADAARKQTSILQGQLDKTKTELDESSQMCRDLGSQVRRLLLEQQAGVISDSEYERLMSELEEVNQREMGHLSDSQQYVNQYLLKFRSIAEMQELNEKQLGTIRNLVDKLESQEAQEVQRKQQQLEQDLQLANAKISTYQSEIERMVAQTKSFVKERDMFRSMLTRRGQIDPTDFSRSLPAGGLSIVGDRASPTPDGNDLAKLVKDLQGHLDNLRNESQTSAASSRKEISQLSERNSALQTETSRYLGQLDAATQKYEMLQSNYQTLKLDHQELQKRAQTAVEAATKQDFRTQQAAEELVEAKGLLDGLRRECANLKAEKDLWKSVEKRLTEDGETLRNERARLDQLNTNLQNIINEKEHSDAESRRRLESQVELLERELQTTKRKLEEELEESKQTALRRSYEHDQSQKRIDELLNSLSASREELAAAKTTKDHLQARVDEMTIELRSAEERLEVLARPPATPARHANGAEESSLSREQELAVEVSELKRDLDLKTAELAKAEEHVEEYKSIAQEAEERLQQLVETNDEDKADLQATLDERVEKVKDLEQRVEDLSVELNSTMSELTKLRDEHAECDRRQEEAQVIHQTEVERLKTHIEKLDDDLILYKEATKEQQKIAEQRQQNYETELVNHTEAVKTVQNVRAEANQLRLELAEFKTRADNATTDLQQKESSWSETESRYKQEVMDIKHRREEVEQHNKSLHASLETLNTQLASLRRGRPTPANDDAADGGEDVSQDLSSFNETIRYLRQEKEIIEVRHHMTSSDLERTKRQLESTQSQLDETRLKLDQVQRSAIDVEKNNMSHNKLMETLNELNLHRESAVTLRAEKKQAEDTLRQRNERVEVLEQELIPLKSRIVELEHLIELRQGEMELLQKDRDSWQQRTQNILSKYDRVDPAELEEMKNKCSELEKARDEAISAQSTLQTQIDGFPEAIEAAKAEQKTRLTEQFKSRDRVMRERREQLQAELTSKTEELEAALNREAENKAAESSTPDDGAQATNQSASSTQIQTLESQISELQIAIEEKDAQIASLTTKQEENKAREEQMRKRLNERLAEVKKEHEAKAEQLKQEAEVEKERAVTERIAEIREQLENEKQGAVAEALKSSSNLAPTEVNNAESSTALDEDQQFVVPQDFDDFIVNITPAQAKLLVQRNSTVSGIVKSNIRKKLSDPKEQESQQAAAIEEQVQERLANEKAALLQEQDAEIARRVAAEVEVSRQQQGAAEQDFDREAIIKEQQDKFEEEKQTLIERFEEEKKEEIMKAKASEQKMAAGKTNLLKTQSANSQAKLAVVKKAAEETPEKPVGEVWEVAKTAKAPPPQQPSTGPAATPSTPAGSGNTNQEAKVGAEPTANGAVSSKPEADSSTEQPVAESSDTAQNVATTPSKEPQSQAPRSNIPQPSSGIPRGGGFANRGQRGNAQAGRNTGIPRPGSSIGNHAPPTNIRGRGGPRGGPNSNTSRGGASLNPNASQFTPGKRPREEEADESMGKRIRGAGS